MEWVTFDNGGDLPSQRQGHTLTRLLDSSFCVLFGGEEDDDSLLNDMHLFDLQTNVWARVTYQSPVCPNPRTLHTTTAISSTSLVIIGGTTSNTVDATAEANNPIEVWIFDLRSSIWKQLPMDDSHAPPSRSGHSAVLIRTAGQVPGIYIFGGFGPRSDSATVHRLRLSDWRWEAVPVVISTPGRADLIVTDPRTASRSVKPDDETDTSTPMEVCPAIRENHSAIWVPALNGMIIFGGESDRNVHGDFWLFSPVPTEKGRPRAAWTWRPLNIRMGGGFVHNGIGPASGSACVLFPTERPMIALWGGVDVHGNIVTGSQIYVVDLLALQSIRVSVKNAPSWGRVLFAIDRYHDQLLVSGGFGKKAIQSAAIQCIKLGDSWKANRTCASEFGPAAARVARGGSVDEALEKASQNNVDLMGTMKLAEPSSGPSSISVGTKFAGKVIGSEDFGTKVSVIIEGKVHQGFLVAYPVKREKGATADKNCAEPDKAAINASVSMGSPGEATGEEEKKGDGNTAGTETTQSEVGKQTNDEQVQGTGCTNPTKPIGEKPKRRKREDLEAALPEEGTVKKRVAPISKGEVITID